MRSGSSSFRPILSSPRQVGWRSIWASNSLTFSPRLQMKHTLARGRLVLAAILVFPCGLAAQSFKVEKVNIGGEGGHDYISVDPASGRVFVSRGTHVMVVDPSGKVLGDIAKTPRVHGVAFAT